MPAWLIPCWTLANVDGLAGEAACISVCSEPHRDWGWLALPAAACRESSVTCLQQQHSVADGCSHHKQCSAQHTMKLRAYLAVSSMLRSCSAVSGSQAPFPDACPSCCSPCTRQSLISVFDPADVGSCHVCRRTAMLVNCAVAFLKTPQHASGDCSPCISSSEGLKNPKSSSACLQPLPKR